MKILLLEYITAGGLNRESLDTGLLLEATFMRDALLRDFNDVAAVQIISTHDERLPQPKHVCQAISIGESSTPEVVWQELLANSDAVLVVAPETGGILTRLTQMIETAGIPNLGSHSKAVSITSDKYETYQFLIANKIATIPTYLASKVNEPDLISNDGFIAKPKDGAGCEATYHFSSKLALRTWLASNPHDDFIIQPYQKGRAASISALFKQGLAWVLSCNEQLIAIQEKSNTITLNGCRVNALQPYLPAFQQLASQIAVAMPTLNGYAGIDVVIEGDEVFVVEINPRITTSYIGLRESLGYNPAQLILDSAMRQNFKLPNNLNHHIVDINLDA